MLDQFSRNLFRGTPQSFACDGMALILAQEAIRSGECERLSREQRGFLYLPFMHSGIAADPPAGAGAVYRAQQRRPAGVRAAA